MRPALAIVVLASGCAELFSIREVRLPDTADGGVTDERDARDAPADGAVEPTLCLEDSFTNGLAAQWLTYGTVMVTNDQLVFPLPTNTSGSFYSGLYGSKRDLTGVIVEYEIVTPPAGMAELALQITSDTDDNYAIAVGEGYIVGQRSLGGVKAPITEIFDPGRHRFVRMRHDPGANEMVYETRGDASGPWLSIGRLEATLGLVDTYFEIYAGTYGVNAATEAVADNFRASCML